MNDNEKSKAELVAELAELRQRVVELESSQSGPQSVRCAARELEERYRLATRAGKVGVWDWNAETNKIYLDPNLKAMLGYANDEIGNCLDDWVELVHPEDRERVSDEMSAHLEGLTPQYDVERRMLHKNGSVLWFSARGTVMRDSRGRPYRIIGTDTDITERKLEEETLRASEATYRALVETSPDAVTATDLEGRITSVSRRTLELHGFGNSEELLGRSAFELIAPEDHERATKNLQRTLGEGTVRNVEYTLLRKDGTRFRGELSASLITDERREPRAFIAITRDITDRERTEKALSESEEKYKRLVEQSLQGLVVLQDSGIVFANRAVAEITGYSVDELLSLPARELDALVHPEDRTVVWDRFRDRLAGETVPEQYECRIVRRDGAVRHVHVYSSRVDYEGRAAIQAAFLDVTQRKRAEDLLRESEEKYRTLTENLNVGVYRNTAGPRGRFIEANPAIVSMFGYESRDEFLSLGVSDLYEDPAEREKFSNMLSRDGIVRNQELRLKRKDGIAFIGSVSAVAVKDAQGRVRHFDGIIEDITDRKLVEEEIRVAGERLRHLLSSTTVVIYTAKASGDFATTFTSDNVSRMVGYGPEEFLEDSSLWINNVHPEDVDRVRLEFPRVLERNAHTYEYRFKCKDGSYIWVRDEMRLVRDEQGEPSEIIGYWVDITKRKLAEERLLGAVQEKEVLLQEIHHRVKNNLQIISSLLDLQKGWITDDTAVRAFVESKNRVRSMALIHEKLYRSGHFGIVNTEAYLPELLDSLFESYRVGHEVVDLQVDVDSVPLSIDIAVPLALIVNELASNCLEHAFPRRTAREPGRQVKGVVHVGLRLEDSGVVALTVADDGLGFPGDLDFRATQTLGLQLVNMLVDQLGATIELDSTRGTRFTIRLPAVRRA